MFMLIHWDLNIDHRFGLIYMINTMIEIKICGKIDISFQINKC